MPIFVKPETEIFDNSKNTFVHISQRKIKLAHSLKSLSEWEERYNRPYLDINDTKNEEEMYYYIYCMIIDPEKDYDEYHMAIRALSQSELQKINDHIKNKATGTQFDENIVRTILGPSNNSAITSAEIIYSKMIHYGIPLEAEYWHLNKLLTLIKVLRLENTDKKENRSDTAARYKALNEQRLKGG